MRRIVVAALTVSLLALGSCSEVHELKAEMIGGRLAFVALGDWWTRPDCFYSIDVRAEESSPASPAPGDDVDAARTGTHWFDWRATCVNEYPIFYGQSLKGNPYRDGYGEVWPHVRPKPLKPGVIYRASTLSPGSSYGSAYFRLNGSGGVENLTWEQVVAQTGAVTSRDAGGS